MPIRASASLRLRRWLRKGLASFFISQQPGKFLTMRLNPRQRVAASLKTIGAVLKEHPPEAPFNDTFVVDDYDEKFRNEERIGQLASLFAGPAIFISCLGLFGMASFIAEQRTKETSVRKMLGDSVSSVVALFAKDFLTLALIAIVIASPIAWYATHRWLQDFAYEIDIEWWVFALAGKLAVGWALRCSR